MIDENTKLKIIAYEKAEMIRNKELENKLTSEFSSCKKNKDKVTSAVCCSEKELIELSNFYDGIHIDDNLSFVSSTVSENYDLLEKDVKDDLKTHLHNLKCIQSSIYKLDHQDCTGFTERDYQTSLYLKYDAKTKEIEAMSELMSLKAEIKYLKFNKSDKFEHPNEIEKEICIIRDEISLSLKKILINQAELRLQGYVEAQVEIQKECECNIKNLSRMIQRQFVRGQMHLSALDDELTTHTKLLDILNSIPILHASLYSVYEQLAVIERVLNQGKGVPSQSADNLLKKIRDSPSKLLAPIIGNLSNVQSLLAGCQQKKKENKALIWTISDKIANSRFCLQKINENVNQFYEKVKNNRALGDSPRLSFITQPHSNAFSKLEEETNSVKIKIKELKKRYEALSADVEVNCK